MRQSVFQSQFVLIFSVALLFSLGLLMVFNTTSAEMIDRFVEVESTNLPVLKQFLYGGVGIVGGLIAYRIGYERLIQASPILLLLVSFLLLLLLIPGFGSTINGSRRWFSLFGVSFQPSECAKILLPMVYIRWFLQKKEIRFSEFMKIMGVLSIPIFLILFEPDHGTTAILLFILSVCLFMTKIRFVYWLLPLCILFSVGSAAAFRLPYVKSRIEVYLHPEKDLRGKGHQQHQSKIAAGSGKLLGRGLGESLQKLNYLPEARSDYIAAIFAEETGFIGVLGLIALYMLFTLSGIFIAMRANDMSGFLLATTLTVLVSIQAFLNLGIVSGLLPSKGTTLPFFSQGGSSLVVNMLVLFLLLDVARKTKKEKYG